MSEEQSQKNEQRSRGSFGYGFGVLFILHFLQVPMTALSGGISVFVIGVTQLVYVIPALVVLILKQRTETAKGLGAAAGITFLLNAACTGIVFYFFD